MSLTGIISVVLTASNLGRKFGSRWVFRHVAFEVGLGDVLVVLGRNGSGKSTLLRLLSGLLSPSEGSVGRPRGAHHRVLGYVGLDLALYPNLTAREHLEIASELRGVPPRAETLLERVGLSAAADRLTGEYSTGMRARLKLALAIQPEPAILLLDEPTASLDDAGREIVRSVIDEQTGRGCVIIATNDAHDRRYATHELTIDG